MNGKVVKANLDGSRAALVSAPEKSPLACLHYELPQLQVLNRRPCLVTFDSWHLYHALS